MPTATLKVKNGSIKLPKNLQNAWKDAEVFVRLSGDTVVLKKVQPSAFWNTWRQTRLVARGITKRDIQDATAWARKQQTR